MPTRIREASAASVATPVDGKPGRFLIQLISPGWGSSGYYSTEVLKAAAEANVWPAGTHMYLDHPSRSEEWDRPERTVRDLAATLAEDCRWDEGLAAIVAESDVFPAWRQPLGDMAAAIGVSIRAYAESEPGEAEGRNGQIVTELVEGISVDFVTHAGRGGKILQVIESARADLPHIREATANDTRDALDKAITDAYGEAEVWVYVLDYDAEATPPTVWFCQNSPDSRVTYAQPYTLSGSTVTLDGAPTEVRPVTTYVPVESGSSTTTESEEGTHEMPQIEEAELTRLRDSDRQLAEAARERDSERARADAAEAERDTLRESQARTERGQTIARIMREALEDDSRQGVTLNDYERRGILADAVVTDGSVDEAATRAAFDKALDKLVGESGRGDARVRTLGGGAVDESDKGDPLADLDALAAESFDGFDVRQEVAG